MGCAALVGAAVAFPAGVIFGGRDAIRPKDAPETLGDNTSGTPSFRKVYSPRIYDDPYVQEQWRKEVEALEARCRDAGEHCTEAKAARRCLSEKH